MNQQLFKFKRKTAKWLAAFAVAALVFGQSGFAFANNEEVEIDEAVVLVEETVMSAEVSEEISEPDLSEVISETEELQEDENIAVVEDKTILDDNQEALYLEAEQPVEVIDNNSPPDTEELSAQPEPEILPCPNAINDVQIGQGVNLPITSETSAEIIISEDSTITTTEDAVQDGLGTHLEEIIADENFASEENEKTDTIYDCEATTIVNDNEATVDNDFVSVGNSGDNDIEGGKDVEDVQQDTGDVRVYGNVLTVVNVNGVNSEVLAMVDNFDKISSDLVMSMPQATAAERAQGLVGSVCSDTTVFCKSLSSFVFDSANKADVDNTAAAIGNSGHNTVSAGKDAENVSINTGDVYAVINILNIVNTTLINSTWQVVATNVFGDVEGDLVLPSAMQLNEWFSVGSTSNLGREVAQVEKVVIDLSVDNEAVIDNEVVVVADTGNNGMETVGEHGDDIRDSEIDTGEALAAAKVTNVANTVLVNTKWVMGIVNILGEWSGVAENIPGQVVVQTGPFGLSFLGVGGLSPEQAGEFLAQMTETDVSETIVEVDSKNDAVVSNHAAAIAETGFNNITAGSDIQNSTIHTGAAKALANIFTWANGTLVNSDLFVGVINIFGDLLGRVVFGYTDLEASQVAPSEIYSAVGSRATYKIHAANSSGADATGVLLEWHYDPELLKILGADIEFATPEPGLMLVSLGNVPYGWQQDMNINVETLKDLNVGDTVSTLIKIYGSGMETNTDNNEHALQVGTIQIPTTTDGEGGASDGNENNDSGDSGVNNQSSGQTQVSQNSGGTIVNTPEPVLRVSKSNNSTGTVVVGQNVEFVIKVHNTDSSPVSGVMLYDTLRGPGGIELGEQVAELGTLESRQVIEIIYTLAVPAGSTFGVYTNAAYVKGISVDLSVIQSWTATSSFTLGQKQFDDSGKEKISEEEKVKEKDEKTDELLESEQLSEQEESNYDIDVLGVSVNNAESGTGGVAGKFGSGIAASIHEPLEVLDILGGQAELSYAKPIWSPENFNISQIAPMASSGIDTQRQLLSTIFICFLIALGYALSNLKQRQAASVRIASRRTSWMKEFGSKLGIF